MSTFGGTELINKLNELNVAGSEKLNAETIDWIFYDNKLKPIAKLLEWLSQAISSEDLLTEDELSMYNEMIENGSLLPEEFLDDIKECMDCTGFNHSERQLSLNIQDDRVTEKELKRKNQLCLQKMELQEEIGKQHCKNASLETDIHATISLLEKQVNSHSKAVENLCTSLDATIINFGKFRSHNKNAKTSYLSQLDLSQWQREEDDCRKSIQAYIDNHFKQDQPSSLDDSSSYCLLDSGKLNADLVKSSNIAEYNSNVGELNRLSQMIELSEVRLIEAMLEKTKFEAHINEMENIIEPSRVPLNAGTLLEEYSRVAVEKNTIQEQFDDQLKQTLLDAKSVAAFERCKTISGDYKAKHRRQENYLKKQDFITDSLLEQLSRYDFMRICLETEKKDLSEVLKLVANLNKLFIEKRNRSSNRQEALAVKEAMPGLEYEQLFANLECKADDNNSCQQLEEKVNESNLRKKFYLDKMESLCGLFEKCIFTEGQSSPTSLPSSWLHPDLIDNSEKLEKDLWSFRQEMLGAIKTIETKKKILVHNPELSEEMFDWVKEYPNVL